MDLSIVIPCYNEFDNIPKLEAEFFPVANQLAKTRSVEVVFVDDGSRDGTYAGLQQAFGASAISNPSIKIEKHPQNRGLGAAIRTGLAAARGDVVVTTDSDATYRFEEILPLLERLTPDVDLVIRTAGEYRISNFMLWQTAYSEFYFSPVCWPDFDTAEMDKALAAYSQRERRLGGDG